MSLKLNTYKSIFRRGRLWITDPYKSFSRNKIETALYNGGDDEYEGDEDGMNASVGESVDEAGGGGEDDDGDDGADYDHGFVGDDDWQ